MIYKLLAFPSVAKGLLPSVHPAAAAVDWPGPTFVLYAAAPNSATLPGRNLPQLRRPRLRPSALLKGNGSSGETGGSQLHVFPTQ
ncbi:hypothetical protein SKAU_G00084960 [Synaphobranchus kaupii]|uniref:Uncharacterized protein n=1 Tax=Synaphobranchus kaupii TaxID=118154 RepID=A0A9Q1FVF5_SYNKA|nr:hypothetical protein SKAU_G00084960 [Synaphobranchus kaupii]